MCRSKKNLDTTYNPTFRYNEIHPFQRNPPKNHTFRWNEPSLSQRNLQFYPLFCVTNNMQTLFT